MSKCVRVLMCMCVSMCFALYCVLPCTVMSCILCPRFFVHRRHLNLLSTRWVLEHFREYVFYTTRHCGCSGDRIALLITTRIESPFINNMTNSSSSTLNQRTTKLCTTSPTQGCCCLKWFHFFAPVLPLSVFCSFTFSSSRSFMVSEYSSSDVNRNRTVLFGRGPVFRDSSL